MQLPTPAQHKHRFPLTFAMGVVLLVSMFTLSFSNDALAVKIGSARHHVIDMVVIHSTGGPICDSTSGRPVWVKAGTLRENIRNIEAHSKLGIHYMIDRDGIVQSSVPENQLAHHVYKYSPQSIAIELINDGDGKAPFAAPQLDALVTLLRDIVHRREIKPAGIKRHSDLDHSRLSCDIKQRRKVDPGSAFPYQLVLDRVFEQN